MRVITVLAFKGGSGKTTISLNLGAALAGRHTVGLIDMDPQGNASSSLPIVAEGNMTVAEALRRSTKDANFTLKLTDFSQAVFPDGSGIFILPTPDSDELSVVGEYLAANPGGEHSLKRALRNTKGLDALLIDTAPSITRLTAAAVSAATSVFTVLTEQRWSVEGAVEAQEYVDDARAFGLTEAKFGGAILNRDRARKNASSSVMSGVVKHSKLPVLKTSIPERVSIQEGELMGVPVVVGSPRSAVAQVFDDLAKEVWRKSKVS